VVGSIWWKRLLVVVVFGDSAETRSCWTLLQSSRCFARSGQTWVYSLGVSIDRFSGI